MSVIRIYCALSAVVHPIIFVHLPLWIVIPELEHDVREAVYGVVLFRCVLPMDLAEIHISTDSPWWGRVPVGF